MKLNSPGFRQGLKPCFSLPRNRLLDRVLRLFRHPLFWLSTLLLILAIAIQIDDPPFRIAVRHAAFDFFQRWYPRSYPDHLPIRVVAIDDASLKVMGQWPWPRDMVAEILNRLFEQGAAIVAFDMVFSEPDRTSPQWYLEQLPDHPGLRAIISDMPDHDLLLSQAISRGGVVIGFAIDPGGDEPSPKRSKLHILEPDGPVGEFLPPYRGAISNLPLLEEAAQGMGVITQDTLDPDGMLRRFCVLFQLETKLYPSLPLEAARLFLKQKTLSVRLHPKHRNLVWMANQGLRGFQLGPNFRPLSSQGQLWSHFRHFQEDRYVSMVALMAGEARGLIAGHIVFIGATARGLGKSILTPLGEQVPGIEMHVQLAEQIMDGSYLLRPDWDGDLTILFLVVSWLGLLPLLWMRHPGWSSFWALLVAGGFFLLSWQLFLNAQLLLDPLYPIGVVVLLYLTLTIARHLAGERERRLVEARSGFLAHVGHEIRTPLNAVIGLTRLCLNTALNTRQRDYLIKVQVAGESLLALTNDILDFSKMDTGMMSLETIPFDLDEVLNHVATIHSVNTREKNLELLFSRDPQIPVQLLGDPLRLGQILINLVGNAVKFTRTGEILLSIREMARKATHIDLEFSVKDTGIGMTQAQSDHLFEAFHQADQSISRRFGGSGLGLAICKHLVEMMGGHIRVESEVNVGSTFLFTIGFEIVAESDPLAFSANPDLRGLRVLMLDDNDTSRRIMTNYLQSYGFTTHEAANWLEVETILARESQPFDLFILDWPIPGLVGAQGIARLRATVGDGSRSRIILVSDWDPEQLAADKGLNPVANVLRKPVNPSFLFNIIMEAFGQEIPASHHRRQKELEATLQVLAPVQWARILLVEDNKINRQVARELLNQARFIVDEAEDGETAVAMVAENFYDCVLMDIQMPGMDGYETVKMIRAKQPERSLPILAMTANTMQEDRERALDAGMNGHIGKPIQPRELFAALLQWVAPGDRLAPVKWAESALDFQGEPKTMASIPGINTATALMRIEGNVGLFRRLLKTFLADHAGDAQQIRESIAHGRREDGLRIAHSLKGVSGSLGMERLYAVVQELEAAIKADKSGSLEPLLQKLTDALSQVVEALQITLSEQEEPQTLEKPAANSHSSEDQLNILEQLIQGWDAQAQVEVKAVVRAYGTGPCRDIAAKLAAHLNQFEFEAAGQTLKALRTVLMNSTGSEPNCE